MRCSVCDKPLPPRRHYCDRCYPLLGNKSDHVKHRVALRTAYDPSIDGFHDHHSVMRLRIDGLTKTWE